MLYLIIALIISICTVIAYQKNKLFAKKEKYDNIFGDNTEFDLSCANSSIQRYIHQNPITTISSCDKKNLLTAENYFRTKYLGLPLNNYNNKIEGYNYYD
jgi:hypothetical protein